MILKSFILESRNSNRGSLFYEKNVKICNAFLKRISDLYVEKIF